MISSWHKLAKITVGIFLCLPLPAYAATEEKVPALLEADHFDYDQEKQVFIATGNVELEQDGQIVNSDQMTYDQKNDVVTAVGNVVFTDKTGQVYFANKVRLEQKFKQGMVEQIGLMFPDGSRFAARTGQQQGEDTIILRDGIYSPCNLCINDPRKEPQWQLRAGKIVHDKKDQDVYYHNVKLDAYGVPVGYLPYFSHPDPNVKSRSGFLMPGFSSDSKNGFMLRNYYYQNISPYEDATLEVSPTQNSGTVYGLDYRKNMHNAKLSFNGSINKSDVRAGGSENSRVLQEDKTRGHIFANGSLALNPYWTTGFDIRRTSDDFYLRDFNYLQADVLYSSTYITRIKDRDYFDLNGTFFQDLRPNIDQEQPDVLPWARYNLMGDPNEMLGGRWNVNNEFVTLFRNGDQSTSRFTTVPTWERRDVLPLGLQSAVTTKLRTDGYWVRQNSPYEATRQDPNLDRTVGRFVPSIHNVVSYPLIRPSNTVTTLVEPKVALTVAPNSTSNDRIPNEDSRDVQMDISNLFDDNRFPGTDQIENGSHMAYGVKMGGYHNNGNSGFLTLGQSYRLNNNSPFPSGSGLEEERSDYVGQLEFTFYEKFYMDYRFQVNEHNFDNRRHELQAYYLGDTLEARSHYVFTQLVAGTGLPSDREQLGFSVAKALTPKWSAAVDTITDLTGDGGLLKAGFALQYKNECLRLAVGAERDLTDNLTGGSDNRVLFSLGLRNLGGYDTPLLQNDPLYQPFGIVPKI